MAAIGMMIGKDNGNAFQRLLNSQDQWKNNVFGKSIKEPPANQLANETIAVESRFS